MEKITKARAAPLTIGRLSDATGVNIETIRYYERIKLLHAPPRTSGGHRNYYDTHVGRLQFVRRARELGFGIDAIRNLLALAERDNSSCQDVRISRRSISLMSVRSSRTFRNWNAFWPVQWPSATWNIALRPHPSALFSKYYRTDISRMRFTGVAEGSN